MPIKAREPARVALDPTEATAFETWIAQAAKKGCCCPSCGKPIAAADVYAHRLHVLPGFDQASPGWRPVIAHACAGCGLLSFFCPYVLKVTEP